MEDRMAKEPSNLVRLSFDLTPELFTTMETLSKKDNISKAEIFRRALGIYILVRRGLKEDRLNLAFADDNNTVIKQLVFPYWFTEVGATHKSAAPTQSNTGAQTHQSKGQKGGTQPLDPTKVATAGA
jgi:hypothetical protein